MHSMSLFVEKNTPVHKMDPITKILYTFVVIAVLLLLPTIPVAISIAVVTFGILCIGKVLRNFLPILAFSGVLMISIIVVQTFFHSGSTTLLWTIGSFTIYKEGLLIAVLLTFRLLNILGAFSILMLTTRPADLVKALMRKGVPAKAGYLFLAVFQIIPQMRTMIAKITDAQRARGMETEGNILIRVKAFFPLIGPVVLNALTDTKERAMAIEMRGFSRKGKRSFIQPPKEYRYHKIEQISLLVIFIFAVFWRIWQ
ncbi:energy-coupling factor transporter transmembrane protein EcfT [Bacillaceae bacterium Marseille-Q3522]|nr:energy-coupling factor transporter transmembrane protein EcfT [Bacillaceae bacterium Marseille-Q3522]